MPFQVLEINRFSQRGEVIRKIRCLAGRVSVFRSHSPGELDKFKKALEGAPQEERFSVLLDDAQFIPQKHVFIGFEELDEKPSARTIANYLSDVGISADNIENLLKDYSLGGLSQASCNQLSVGQWSTLRLVRVLYAPSIPWAIVLHEPLQDIPEQFRESLAEQIALCAWKKQAIIIVTKLSYRPQSWIENEHIARIQLERPRQGTIGFGGGELSTPEAIFALRKEMGIAETKPVEENSSLKPAIDLLTAEESKAKFNSAQSVFYAVSALLLIIIGVGSYQLLSGNTVQVAAIPVSVTPQQPMVQPENVQKESVSNERREKEHEAPPPPPVDLPNTMGELFPDEVRVAWSQAVMDPVAALKDTLTNSPSFRNNEALGPTENSAREWESESGVSLPEELNQLKEQLKENPGA